MKIEQLRINQLKEGMVIAEDVYTKDNKLVITKGTVWSDLLLDCIKACQIYRIGVYVPETKENKTVYRKEKVRASVEFQRFKKKFEHTVVELKKTFSRIAESNEKEAGEVDQLTKQIDDFFQKSSGTFQIMEMLNCMREYDDVTFAHCISVALLCRLMGEWKRLSRSELYVLTMCGLLHDIGKVKIPDSIIKKTGALTKEEFQIVKAHPRYGYEIMKDRNIDERVKYAALHHHERMDGSGYPLGLQGTKLDDFSRIVMIADVYDAMTADRPYRSGMCPYEVLSIMEEEGFSKYDTAMLMMFLEKTSQSYIGSDVLLSDQRIGEIVSVDKIAPCKPLIRVGTQFIDLKEHKDIKIQKIV